MTAHPTRPARRLPAAAPLLALALAALPLASCGGPDPDRFPPPCPSPIIAEGFGDLHIARGNGRDITDAILDGRITGISEGNTGTCTRDTTSTTVVTFAVDLTLTRGPANPSRVADVSYIVGVSQGEAIVDRKLYTLHAEFPPNTDRLHLEGDQIVLRLPVTPQKTAASYRVTVGFQLTPAQVEANRTRPRP